MTEQTPTPEQSAAAVLDKRASQIEAFGPEYFDDADALRRAAAILDQFTSDAKQLLPEPTQAEVDAFTAAWEAERPNIGRGISPAGQKTRAGLRAAFAVRSKRTHVTTDDVIAVFNLYGDTYGLETVHDLADLANGAGR